MFFTTIIGSIKHIIIIVKIKDNNKLHLITSIDILKIIDHNFIITLFKGSCKHINIKEFLPKKFKILLFLILFDNKNIIVIPEKDAKINKYIFEYSWFSIFTFKFKELDIIIIIFDKININANIFLLIFEICKLNFLYKKPIYIKNDAINAVSNANGKIRELLANIKPILKLIKEINIPLMLVIFLYTYKIISDTNKQGKNHNTIL